MKIALICEFPFWRLPGWEEAKPGNVHYATWLPPLSEAFRDMLDLDIHWVTLSERVTARKSRDEGNQHFHVLPTTAAGRLKSFFRKDLANIAHLLDEIDPDVVHGWGSEDVHGLAAVRSGRPNVFSLQGLMSYYAIKTKLDFRSRLMGVLELYLLKKADAVTIESHWGAAFLRKWIEGAKLSVIEYGVDSVFYDCTWQPLARKKSVIFIGSLVQRKGIEELVMASTHPEVADTEFIIAGSGEDSYVRMLKKIAGPNVRFAGRLDRAALLEEMCSAWCLVHPTRADTSPNVVKEARVVGLPVITTRHGGQVSYVDNGKNGVILPEIAPGQISKAITQVCASLEECMRMGAWHHDEHRYILSPARTAESFRALYEKCAQASTNRKKKNIQARTPAHS